MKHLDTQKELNYLKKVCLEINQRLLLTKHKTLVIKKQIQMLKLYMIVRGIERNLKDSKQIIMDKIKTDKNKMMIIMEKTNAI